MEGNARDPVWPEWIGLGGRAVIGFAPDGGHSWKEDSHPALAPEQLRILVQTQCTELERRIADLDALLAVARESGDSTELDGLLDWRARLTGRLRVLRNLQAELSDMDAAA